MGKRSSSANNICQAPEIRLILFLFAFLFKVKRVQGTCAAAAGLAAGGAAGIVTIVVVIIILILMSIFWTRAPHVIVPWVYTFRPKVTWQAPATRYATWSGQHQTAYTGEVRPLCPASCQYPRGMCIKEPKGNFEYCQCLNQHYGQNCEYTCMAVCGDHGTCVGMQQCKCYDGYTGVYCDIPPCKKCVQGICVNGQCKCNFGYMGDGCDLTVCVALKQCGKHGICTNLDECTCDRGFFGPACTITCKDASCGGRGRGSCHCDESNIAQGKLPCQCKCEQGWSGENCTEPECCADMGCMGRGECVAPDVCKCRYGYTGHCCETTICDLPCQHGHHCVLVDADSSGGFTWENATRCRCDEMRWKGMVCEQPVCSAGCNGNGLCVAPKSCLEDIFKVCNERNFCECFSGFTGSSCNVCQDCKHPARDKAGRPICSIGGVCQRGKCAKGWTGEKCDDVACFPPCQPGRGTCVFKDGVVKCECKDAFYGDSCSLEKCPFCDLKNGECQPTGRTYKCVCTNKNFTGNDCRRPNCDVPNMCHVFSPPGKSCIEVMVNGTKQTNCTDINECEGHAWAHTCNMATTNCSNRVGSFLCECKDGFGQNPDILEADVTTCSNINECDLKKHDCAKKDTVCIDTVGSFICQCNESLSDKYVMEKVEDHPGPFNDLHKCKKKTTTCGTNEILDATEGRCVIKSCPEGMMKVKNRNCSDIDECVDKDKCSKPDGIFCHNTIGSFLCVCNKDKGMVQVFNTKTKECDDIDECAGDTLTKMGLILGSETDDPNSPCEITAPACTNTVGSFICCQRGFHVPKSKSECEDVDECDESNVPKLNNCDPVTMFCANTNGSFECKCSSGYERISKPGEPFQCSDTDECWEDMQEREDDKEDGEDEGSPICSSPLASECLNHPGSFLCCLPENTVVAVGTGLYQCGCSKGYVPREECDEDGVCYTKCDDDDECDESINRNKPCRNLGEHLTCVNTEGDFLCCPPGSDARDCVAGSLDQCVIGMHMDALRGRCVDVNECHELVDECDPGKDEVCENMVVSQTSSTHQCACSEPHFTPLPPQPGTSQPGTSQPGTSQPGTSQTGELQCGRKDECGQGMGTVACDPEASRCRANEFTGYTCDCNDGYKPSTAPGTKTCFNVDECLYQFSHLFPDTMEGWTRRGQVVGGEMACSLVAYCRDLQGNYQCECPEGYMLGGGNKCEDIDECKQAHEDEDVCANAANGALTCANTAGAFRCTCANTPGSFRCTCKQGMHLNMVGECVDTDECEVDMTATVAEQRRHNCLALMKAKHKARKPFFETDCTEENSGETIHGHVTTPLCNITQYRVCVNTAGSFWCKCMKGFEEENGECIKIKQCGTRDGGGSDGAGGSHGAGGGSDGAGGSHGAGGGSDGGGGSHDKMACDSMEQCRLLINCKEGEDYLLGSFYCVCPKFFVMNKNGTECVDTDECNEPQLQPICKEDEECHNFVNGGGYTCVPLEPVTTKAPPISHERQQCDSGSFFDGSACVDIDECACSTGEKTGKNDGCDSAATVLCPESSQCKNTVPGFQCVCNENYQYNELLYRCEPTVCAADPGLRGCPPTKDPCQAETCPCPAHLACRRTGWYDFECICPFKWAMEPDSKECIFKDECKEDNTICRGGKACTDQGPDLLYMCDNCSRMYEYYVDVANLAMSDQFVHWDGDQISRLLVCLNDKCADDVEGCCLNRCHPQKATCGEFSYSEEITTHFCECKVDYEGDGEVCCHMETQYFDLYTKTCEDLVFQVPKVEEKAGGEGEGETTKGKAEVEAEAETTKGEAEVEPEGETTKGKAEGETAEGKAEVEPEGETTKGEAEGEGEEEKKKGEATKEDYAEYDYAPEYVTEKPKYVDVDHSDYDYY